MPIPTAFHSRTGPLCESHEWRDWSGFLAAAMYEHSHEHEYYAIRNAAALIDVSPLFKYEVRGPQALQLVNRVMTRDLARCVVGQVMYSPWCDDRGKVIDDGTIARLEPDRFRITAADPNLAWFQDCGFGLEATIEDVSQKLAALAVQGPNARRVLQKVVRGADLETLKYYHLAKASADGIPIEISRTGYTGDLGFELWAAPDHAGRLWDLLVDAGGGYGLTPVGMVALDLARIEAGLVLIQVDYISARQALIPDQTSSPFEIGLGWTVDLRKEAFVGRKALLEEKRRGSPWQLVGLEIDWGSLEVLFGEVDLVPRVAGRASREAVPVYRDGRQVGQATSRAFSPILKKYIALATLESRAAAPGNQVEVEVTVEYSRKRAVARVVELPFFNPPRKRAIQPASQLEISGHV
jgi:aminomethyltransferase